MSFVTERVFPFVNLPLWRWAAGLAVLAAFIAFHTWRHRVAQARKAVAKPDSTRAK